MRKDILLTWVFVTIQCYHIMASPETTTLRIEERIRILKQKLRGGLRNHHPAEPAPIPDYYDFEENAPIPPILEKESLRDDNSFRLRTLKSFKQPKKTRKEKNSKNNLRSATIAEPLTEMVQYRKPMEKPLDVFYRKSFDPNVPAEWLHCAELVTPYVKGLKSELTAPRRIGPDAHVVQRLLQLLSANNTKLGRSEKRSIMFQISRLKIRLYDWNENAVVALLHLLVKGSHKVDFASIKRGIKKLFDFWTTDLSNTTTLLMQARIFRPPCFQGKDKGSSKLVRGSTIPSPKLVANSEECSRKGFENCL